MLKVAFIDDGVLPVFHGLHIHQYFVNHDKVHPFEYRSPLPEHSHATTCVAIFLKHIEQNIEDVQIISIKVLNGTGNGTLNDVITAINWAIKNEIKVINLSLGGIHFSQFAAYNCCLQKAQDSKVIIVAAQSNDGVYTYPASFSNVIGVKAIKDDQSDVLLNESFFFDGIEFCAKSVFDLNLYTPNGHTTERSNSFAAPVVTASVVKICLEDSTLDVFDVKRRICSNFKLNHNHIAFEYRNMYFRTLYARTKQLKVTVDIPVVECVISGPIEEIDTYFQILKRTKLLLAQEDYNCGVLTNLSCGVSCGFQICEFNLDNYIISQLAMYQNIDIMIVIAIGQSSFSSHLTPDMTVCMNNKILHEDQLLQIIKSNFT